MYELDYGKPHGYKAVKISDFDQALRMFAKAKAFAISHNLTWTVSLWEKCNNGKRWLIKSETLNPTSIIS